MIKLDAFHPIFIDLSEKFHQEYELNIKIQGSCVKFQGRNFPIFPNSFDIWSDVFLNGVWWLLIQVYLWRHSDVETVWRNSKFLPWNFTQEPCILMFNSHSWWNFSMTICWIVSMLLYYSNRPNTWSTQRDDYWPSEYNE